MITEIEQLKALIEDYYLAVQIGAQMEDPTPDEVQDYEERMSALQQCAEKLLHLDPHVAYENFTEFYAVSR